jgi:hypothetical protein
MEEDIEEGFADYAILKQKKRYYLYSMHGNEEKIN